MILDDSKTLLYGSGSGSYFLNFFFTDPEPTIQNVRTVSGCGSSLFCELIVQFTVLHVTWRNPQSLYCILYCICMYKCVQYPECKSG